MQRSRVESSCAEPSRLLRVRRGAARGKTVAESAAGLRGVGRGASVLARGRDVLARGHASGARSRCTRPIPPKARGERARPRISLLRALTRPPPRPAGMADLMMHPDLLLGVNKLASPVGRMAVSAERSAVPARDHAHARSVARRRHLQLAAASPRPLPIPFRSRFPPKRLSPSLPQALLRWYLSGWHFKTLGVKKPYNPIVGECALSRWRRRGCSRYHALPICLRSPRARAISLAPSPRRLPPDARSAPALRRPPACPRPTPQARPSRARGATRTAARASTSLSRRAESRARDQQLIDSSRSPRSRTAPPSLPPAFPRAPRAAAAAHRAHPRARVRARSFPADHLLLVLSCAGAAPAACQRDLSRERGARRQRQRARLDQEPVPGAAGGRRRAAQRHAVSARGGAN